MPARFNATNVFPSPDMEEEMVKFIKNKKII
jgi:hypothetical protein